jgi:hypothetical protein
MTESSEFVHHVLLDQEVDGGVDQVVDDSGHCEDPADNADYIHEESVPLLVTEDV